MSFDDADHTDSRHGLLWPRKKEDLRTLDGLDHACVYAIGPENGRPLKVGWSLKPLKRFHELQAGSWKKLRVYAITWTAGEPLAKRLLQTVHEILDKSGRRLEGDWFDITPEFAIPAVQIATEKLGIPTFTHDALLDRVFAVRERRVERALN